jgi:hypothetical protein
MHMDVSWERLWEQNSHSRHPAEGGGEVRVLSMDRVDVRRGGRSTRKVSSRNGAGAFSWSMHGLEVGEIPQTCFSKPKPKVSSILQRAGVDQRYFLTPKACAGILDRAQRRGKKLPELLEAALSASAGRAIPAPVIEGETTVYRVYAAFSSAMTSNGVARAADEVETTRSPDTTGGFATNQGGNIVLDDIHEILKEEPLVFDNNQVTSVLNYSKPKPGDPVHPLTYFGHPPFMAMSEESQIPVDEAVYQEGEYGVARYDTAGTLRAGRIPEHQQVIMPSHHKTMRVRRLTPLECLRLQGFPDNYLSRVHVKGKPLSDGAIYKMAGNSWAVPVVEWIFSRLEREAGA